MRSKAAASPSCASRIVSVSVELVASDGVDCEIEFEVTHSGFKFFLLSLAVCHTCLPEQDEYGDLKFQAASPDELALVQAAQELGYVVVDRGPNTLTIRTFPSGVDDDHFDEVYEILDIIEFSSARKRMSVIVRMPDQRICLFCK